VTPQANSEHAPKGPQGRTQLARDLLELTKPGIVRMCLVMTAGGLWLAPGPTSWGTWLSALVGSGLAVASANAFNMAWEHEGDRKMARTRTRPVAAGRLPVRQASMFAAGLGVLSMLVLTLGANVLTAVLAAFALLSYVLVYTPLKRVSPLALVVGAVPGAVPPLLGWTSATGNLELPGVVLFGILLVWQMPHFLAIAIFRKPDYANAGIMTVPVVRGELVAKIQAIAWAVLLVPVSIALTPLGVTGNLYLGIALALGLGFLAWTVKGLASTETESDVRWARQLFFMSLVYLPALSLALVADFLWEAWI